MSRRKKDINPNDTENIKIALGRWLGYYISARTTKSLSGSQGNSAYIKQHRPIVVPIVIDGFRRSFDKRDYA
jgi:hypothetical protein